MMTAPIVWTLQILLLICSIEKCVSLFQLDDVYDEIAQSKDAIRELLERTYVGGQRNTANSSDVGSPLLLTPYIEQKKLNKARAAARVDFEHIMPGVTSYAGYLTVNKQYNANLWFWYFPVSHKNVKTTPWILWLQGGPGAPSTYGLFEEIGPFYLDKNKNLKERKHSWGKNHSLLFIDNPVGTGFSFTHDMRGYATNQTTIGENLYNALQQFLTLFPELRKAPLIIAGESYAGKHVPSIGVQILWHRHEDEEINLRGLAIGNGFIDPDTLQSSSSFYREVGLVSDDIAEEINEVQVSARKYISEDRMIRALVCESKVMRFLDEKAALPNVYNYLDNSHELFGAFVNFLDGDEVRRALHVGNTSFTTVGNVYSHLILDIMRSYKTWFEELLENYRVMVYSGHLDARIPYPASVNTYKSLKFTGSEAYKHAERRPWVHNDDLLGYYRIAGNLTEVMVRGAGHMVPTDKPAAALALITAFVKNASLSQDTGYLSEP